MRVRIVINDGIKWNDGITWHGLTWLRQFFCGLTGHDDDVKLQRRRMQLVCARCGRTTAGWTLDGPEPEADAQRTRGKRRFLEPAGRRS